MMQISEQMLVVLCTLPDPETAKTLAQSLVSRHLAACVQVLSGLQSYFYWEDQLECAHETLLMIKTSQNTFPALELYLCEHHPYKIPEIIALPITVGHAPYLSWLANMLQVNPHD